MEIESGILTAEQVERIRARDRKRKQRANEKSAEAAAQAETPDVFWKRNRDVANQTQLADLLERQAYVFALLDDVRVVMEGRSPDEEFTTDVEEEIRADVAEHGVCQIEIYLLEFWKSPDTFAQLTKHQDATSTFARYGLVTAIPDHRLHEWETWLKTKSRPNFYAVFQKAVFNLWGRK